MGGQALLVSAPAFSSAVSSVATVEAAAARGGGRGGAQKRQGRPPKGLEAVKNEEEEEEEMGSVTRGGMKTEPEKEGEGEEEAEDVLEVNLVECVVCRPHEEGRLLVCCDSCPRSYHAT